MKYRIKEIRKKGEVYYIPQVKYFIFPYYDINRERYYKVTALQDIKFHKKSKCIYHNITDNNLKAINKKNINPPGDE